MQSSPQPVAMQAGGGGLSAGGLAELSTFMNDQHVLLEKQQMALLERTEQTRHETEAKMETRMEEQRQQLQEQRQQIEELKAPQEAISAEQVQALAARLEAMHAAKMLSDDELFAVEDCVADFVEARTSCEIVTMETVNTVRAVGKAHKLVALGEAMSGDAMFARQLRRKFV